MHCPGLHVSRELQRLTLRSVLCWSLSFYPQPLLNYKRRSTLGLTVDFPMLNVLGFLCYTISTASFLYSPTIRRQYAVRHPLEPVPTVRFNDFAFALHALILCIIIYSQFWHRLWSFEELKGKRASRIVQGIYWGSVAGLVVIALIVLARGGDGSTPEQWAAIDVVCPLTCIHN